MGKYKRNVKRNSKNTLYIHMVCCCAIDPICRIPASAACKACADLLTPSAISWLNAQEQMILDPDKQRIIPDKRTSASYH